MHINNTKYYLKAINSKNMFIEELNLYIASHGKLKGKQLILNTLQKRHKYKHKSEIFHNNYTLEDQISISIIFEELVDTLTETQKYILTYILLKSKLSLNTPNNLKIYKTIIQNKRIDTKQKLYKLLHSRRHVDKEWSNLLTIIRRYLHK